MVVYQLNRNQKKGFFSFWENLSLTTKLIGINVFTFAVFWILIALKVVPLDYIALNPSLFLHDHYFWTLLTSMFMHGGFFHLFANMVTLYFFGSLIEKILGKKRYFWFYMIAGFVAGILFVISPYILNVDWNTFAVGASGAIFGLAGVLIFLTPNLPVYLMFIPIPVKMKYAIPGMLVLLWLISVSAGLPIGNVAHLGGLLTGVGYGLYLRKKFPNKIKYVQRHFS
jgi:membrane associated rhomboid family serine protease